MFARLVQLVLYRLHLACPRFPKLAQFERCTRVALATVAGRSLTSGLAQCAIMREGAHRMRTTKTQMLTLLVGLKPERLCSPSAHSGRVHRRYTRTVVALPRYERHLPGFYPCPSFLLRRSLPREDRLLPRGFRMSAMRTRPSACRKHSYSSGSSLGEGRKRGPFKTRANRRPRRTLRSGARPPRTSYG